jgi:hypothetical protein
LTRRFQRHAAHDLPLRSPALPLPALRGLPAEGEGGVNDGTDIAVAKDEPRSLLDAIVRLASNPDLDIEKFGAIIEMQERMQRRQAEIAYNQAMNEAQAEIQPVARTAENSQTKSFYAKLEDVDAAIRPIYLRNGFSLSFGTVEPLVPGNIRVECTCAHAAGHSEKFHREAPADTLGPKGSPVKTVLHGGGSTETFLKRYLTCGVFNVVFKNMDDDGVAAGNLLISDQSVKVLSDLLVETKGDLAAFLRFMAVDGLPDIRVGNYPTAVNALLEKRRRSSENS